MPHQIALRVEDKAFSNGDNYHVGMTGFKASLTSQPGFTHAFTTYTDPDTGYTRTDITIEKIND